MTNPRLDIKGGWTFDTIPEEGRENYRKMVRAVLTAIQSDGQGEDGVNSELRAVTGTAPAPRAQADGAVESESAPTRGGHAGPICRTDRSLSSPEPLQDGEDEAKRQLADELRWRREYVDEINGLQSRLLRAEQERNEALECLERIDRDCKVRSATVKCWTRTPNLSLPSVVAGERTTP